MNPEGPPIPQPPGNLESPPSPLPAEAAEAVELRFPEVYKSPEWKQLDSVDRAQLLLVAEGVKPGTIVGGDFTNFAKIIPQLGLETSLNTDPRWLRPVYMVARPEILTKYHRDVIATPETKRQEPWHRLNGKFLGYPECCTEEYIKPQKNIAARDQLPPKQREEWSNFVFEAEQMVKKGEPYPAELDFRPPSFTPCSVNCPEALPLLRKWQRVIETADPEAARDLQIFNWGSEPYRTAHKDELAAIKKTEDEKKKIEFLRKSLREE